MLSILHKKQKQKETVINNQGSSLIVVLITVFIIALLTYGAYYFSDEKCQGEECDQPKTTNQQIQALNQAKTDLSDINKNISEKDDELKEILKK